MPAQTDDWVLRDPDTSNVPPTELVNPRSIGIDAKCALDIVRTIHEEDRKAWEAASAAAAETAVAVEEVVRAFRSGGRLIHVGAGTSGRLGVLDASECPPTFGVDARLVVGLIAGGERAIRESVEGAEDSAVAGAVDVRALDVGEKDVVCGIAASGTTPYVWGALEEAARKRAFTVLITCNPRWQALPQAPAARHAIVLPVGPEIVAGSTRMKAGTATKLVLNAISTAAMIRWGKVHDNLMVDLKPLNQKLKARSVRLVERIAQVSPQRALELLDASGGNVKAAIVMAKKGVQPARAAEWLDRHGGVLRRVLEE